MDDPVLLQDINEGDYVEFVADEFGNHKTGEIKEIDHDYGKNGLFRYFDGNDYGLSDVRNIWYVKKKNGDKWESVFIPDETNIYKIIWKKLKQYLLYNF